MEKNPEYWQDGKPYLDKITFRYITDVQTVTNALRTHEADVALKLAASEVDTLDVSDIDMEVHPSLGVTLCYFNFSRPPFNDLRVRRVPSSLAVDREASQPGALLRARRTGERRCSLPVTGQPIRTSERPSPSIRSRPAS